MFINLHQPSYNKKMQLTSLTKIPSQKSLVVGIATPLKNDRLLRLG